MKDLTSGYNKMVRPGFFEKETGVGIELYILGIPNVDDEYMELNLDMYFRQVDNFPSYSIGNNSQFKTSSMVATVITFTYIYSIGMTIA